MNRSLHVLLYVTLMIGSLTFMTGCPSEPPPPPPPVDTDGDGLNDDEETKLGTDPAVADTDGDGLNDYEEVNQYNTDPLTADSDGDGLEDGEEVLSYNTDPLKPDTDGDGLNDYDEVMEYNTNPNKSDSDGDGLSDYEEAITYNTNPNNPDSDGNGFNDYEEIQMGTDPNDSNDPVYIKDEDLNTINFDFDKSNITDQAAQQLSENVQMLQDNTKFRVRVNAYTDHIGGDQYNLRLSKRRANSVLKFYTDNGIAEDRVEAQGLGKAPIPCASEDPNGRGCRENRRAESIPVNPYQYTPDM